MSNHYLYNRKTVNDCKCLFFVHSIKYKFVFSCYGKEGKRKNIFFNREVTWFEIRKVKIGNDKVRNRLPSFEHFKVTSFKITTELT
jgi:hypothetical protein